MSRLSKEELEQIESRQDINDIPRLVSELKHVMFGVHMANIFRVVR